MYKQQYKMLLCREAEKSKISFADLARKTYKLMMLFNELLPMQYRPNYETTNKKCDAKIYDWSYEQFYNDLKKGINHTKDAVFEELGYSISFFSSLNNSECVGYILNVGATNNNVQNFLSVSFPPAFDYFKKSNSSLLEDLFVKCVTVFGASYGKVANSCIFDGKGTTFNLNGYKVEHLQWLNYFLPEKFNIEKQLKSLTKLNHNIVYSNGFLKLKDIAIDSTNTEDMDLVNKIDATFQK